MGQSEPTVANDFSREVADLSPYGKMSARLALLTLPTLLTISLVFFSLDLVYVYPIMNVF